MGGGRLTSELPGPKRTWGHTRLEVSAQEAVAGLAVVAGALVLHGTALARSLAFWFHRMLRRNITTL